MPARRLSSALTLACGQPVRWTSSWASAGVGVAQPALVLDDGDAGSPPGGRRRARGGSASSSSNAVVAVAVAVGAGVRIDVPRRVRLVVVGGDGRDHAEQARLAVGIARARRARRRGDERVVVASVAAQAVAALVGDLERPRPQAGIVGDVQERLLAAGAAAPAHEPPDGLAEEQLGGRRGGVDADGEPGDVDALADHPHGDQPRVGAGGEAGDAGRRRRVVAGDDDGVDARGASCIISAMPRAWSWSVAMIEPAGVGGRRRGCASSRSWALRSTVGSHWPSSDSAVRRRCADRAASRASSKLAATSLPSGATHSMSPPIRGKYTGRTTRPSRSASP